MPANLYLSEVDILKYLRNNDCGECGISSCRGFVEAVRNGRKEPKDCAPLTNKEIYAFNTVLKASIIFPEVPLLTQPRPGSVGLFEINNPGPESPVIVSGNNEYTEQVILAILGTTSASFFVLFADTNGNTVDMAMVYKTLTCDKIERVLRESGLEERVTTKEMIIPGFASDLSEDIETATGWKSIVGPVCALEIPLFLAKYWTEPQR